MNTNERAILMLVLKKALEKHPAPKDWHVTFSASQRLRLEDDCLCMCIGAFKGSGALLEKRFATIELTGRELRVEHHRIVDILYKRALRALRDMFPVLPPIRFGRSPKRLQMPVPR